MNVEVGRIRQLPSRTRSSTQAWTSRPWTLPSSGVNVPTTTRAGTPQPVGGERHERGVLLVVADDPLGADELPGEPVDVVPGRHHEGAGAVAVAAVLLEVAGEQQDLRQLVPAAVAVRRQVVVQRGALRARAARPWGTPGSSSRAW